MMVTRQPQADPLPGRVGALHGAGPAGLGMRPGRWVTVSEWERGLLFRYGRLITTLEPGRHRQCGAVLTPCAVDMRPWVVMVPAQEVPTADGASVKLTIAAQARVTEPAAYVTATQRARGETAALRSLANAARLAADKPALFQLRLLQQLDGSAGHIVVIGTPPAGAPT